MIRLTIAGLLFGVLMSAVTVAEHRASGRKIDALETIVAAQTGCNVALAGPDVLVSAERCPPALAAVHTTALRAQACDQALLEAELFTVRATCSTEVMTLLAQRDAEGGRADRLAETLEAERIDRAAAITRAEIRARTETERTHRAEAALQSAPRSDAGLVVLDARRLCEFRDATAACDHAQP